MIQQAKELVFGNPWVYRRLRPWVLGGLDHAMVYRRLEAREDDTVLDIGCGMGDAMNYLTSFRRYHGFDTDHRAIDSFHKLHPGPNIELYTRRCELEDIQRIAPTKALMVGFLHHVTDPEATALLQPLVGLPAFRRAVTLDPTFIPGHLTNNVLARADRGQFVRSVEDYEALVRSAGLEVRDSFWIENGLHVARYYGMVIEPPSRPSGS